MATVDEQIAEVKLGFLCHPKKLTGDRIARGELAASPAQKLPPTATYWHFVAAKPLRSFQPLQFFSCPSRAVIVLVDRRFRLNAAEDTILRLELLDSSNG
jgi:hypothetical protein